MLTLWGLSPKLHIVELNNVVEVVVGTPSDLSCTPIQSACPVVYGVTVGTAGPPGATTVPAAETYHQYEVATARVGARCHSSFAIPAEG